MTFTSRGTSEILVAGEQDKMFIIDLVKGEIIKQVPTEHHYKIMRRSRQAPLPEAHLLVHILPQEAALLRRLLLPW